MTTSEFLNEQQTNSSETEKAIHLVDYLTELALLRTPLIRKIDAYQKVFWISGIPRKEGCFTRAWENDEEHESDDMRKAKGVNLDSSLISIPKYKLAKVVVLSAFDRSKDTMLANMILKGKRNTYSMGAVVTYFTCSVCSGVLGPGVKRTCSCQGTDLIT